MPIIINFTDRALQQMAPANRYWFTPELNIDLIAVTAPIAFTMKPNSLMINMVSKGSLGSPPETSGADFMSKTKSINPKIKAMSEKGLL